VIWVAGILVVTTLVVMASGKVPAVLVLGCSLSLAGILHIAPPQELFAGLANSGVITVAGMLVIAKGVVRTGAVARITWRLLARVSTAAEALLRLVVPIGVLSSLINTTPIVAMLIPATRELQQSRRVPAREVLLPITHATTLAGSITLIGTSSNLVIAGIAGGLGVHLTMLSFAPVALPVAVVGSVLLLVVGPRLLSGSVPTADKRLVWRVEIPVAPHANVAGRPLAVVGVEHTQEYALQHLYRNGQDLPSNEPVAPGDTLVYDATEEGVVALWGSPRFGQSPQKLFLATPGADARGHLRDLEYDGRVQVVAAQTSVRLDDAHLMPGDPVYVTADSSQALRDNEVLSLYQDAAGRAPQPAKTYVAVAILLGVIVAASINLVAVSLAAFTGAILMVVTGVLTPRSAARALDWNVLFILAGSIGLGTIVTSSGLADEIAVAVRGVSDGKVVMVVVTFTVITTVLTNATTNAAAAAILTPVAIGIAQEAGMNPVTVLALIGTCISFTFLNPFAHQSNLMVMRPGGYDMASFLRVGVPLVLVSTLTVAVVTWLLVR